MFGLFITVTMMRCRGVGSWVAVGGSGVAIGWGSMMYSSMEELGFCGNKGEEGQDSECLKMNMILLLILVLIMI